MFGALRCIKQLKLRVSAHYKMRMFLNYKMKALIEMSTLYVVLVKSSFMQVMTALVCLLEPPG